MPRRSPARAYALVIGYTLVAAGILGFFYNASFGTGDGTERDAVLGILDVNGWHNVVHIATGALGLAVAASYGGSRVYALGLGAVYLLVAALGFIADLGPVQHWGIEVEKRHVVVDPSMRTNLARVFAAGDITEYPGKVRLIAVGFGEAATAVNNATVAIDPSAKVFPGHSSDA